MKKRRKWPWVCGASILLIGVWFIIRITGTVPRDMAAPAGTANVYSEEQERNLAICLSYLVYGCERADKRDGTVSEMLDSNRMGIIIESAGVRRSDEADPATAVINTEACIREWCGDFRFLTDLQNERDGFYGAAFADDEAQAVWVAYAGSVTLSDAISCAGLVLAPGLSGQEREAFDCLDRVLKCDEVSELGYSVYLTGHSLGGALATELSLVTGIRAVTINGADGLAYDKIKAIMIGDGEKPQLKVTNHMTSTEGGDFNFMSFVQRLMYLGSYRKVDHYIYRANGCTTDTHCAFSFWGQPIQQK